MYFTRDTLPQFASLTWDFESSFMNFSFQLIVIGSLSVCICIYEVYLVKPSYFCKLMIYVKSKPEAGNTAHTCHLHFLYFNEQ